MVNSWWVSIVYQVKTSCFLSTHHYTAMPSATMFLAPYMAHTYFLCMIDGFFQKFGNLLAIFKTKSIWECSLLNWKFRKSCSSLFSINFHISIETLLNFFRRNIIWQSCKACTLTDSLARIYASLCVYQLCHPNKPMIQVSEVFT